jgi:DNA-binding SARP family transcriptional activator
MDDDNDEEGTSCFPSFRIWLCGTFRVERRVGSSYEFIRTTEWGGSSYPRLLLKALLCSPGWQARRDALLDMLWPDAELEQAVQNLNTAVTRLRRVLAPSKGEASLLLTDEDSRVYRLAEQSLLWVDADAALTRLSEAERRGRTSSEALPLLEEAESYLSKGMILQDEEGHWAAGRRATVEQARYRCRLWLAEAYAQQQMPGQAETILSLLLEEDPIDEDVLARLMLLLHRQGMTQQALRRYHAFMEIAAREELEPTEDMRLLAERLRSEKQRSVSDLLDLGESAERPSSTPGDVSMLQLAKEQQVAERGPLVQMETGQRIVVPSGSDVLALPLPLHPIPLEMISMENALWFVLKQHQWETLVSSYSGQALSWEQLQAQLDEEFHTMKPRPLDREYTFSRRQALMTIAAGPVTLLLELQKRTRPDLVEEELLPCCAASIAACWHLMRGSEFALVDEVLSKYLSLLERIAVRSSNYQTVAAGLASQGCRIKGILALHRLDAATRERSFQQAVFYSDIASDPRLQTAALISLAYHNLNPIAAEQIYRQALQHTQSLSPLLLARLYAELAVTVAKQSNKQEAFQYLNSAQEIYPDYPEQDACFLYAEFSPSSLIMENGRTWLALSEHYPDEDFALQAMTTLRRIEGLQHQSMVPQRIDVEITNYRAKTALMMKERDAFCGYLKQGIRGAHLLGSQKRRDEAMMLYRDASLLWLDEKPMKELKDVFLEPKSN